MSSDEEYDESDDEAFSATEPNALEIYDQQVQNIYGHTLTDGRFVLHLVSSESNDFDKAYETLQKANDLVQYLEEIGAIRVGNINMHEVYKFCASPHSYTQFDYTNNSLPFEIIDNYNLAFVVNDDRYTICEQQDLVNFVCAAAQNPRRCYERKLRLTEVENTDSSVVLSKQLMRFLCKNVNRLLSYAFDNCMQTIATLINMNWERFQKNTGPDKLDYIEIHVRTLPNAINPELRLTISKQDHITMLRGPPYNFSETLAYKNTNAEAFRPYVKRRLKNELIDPNKRRMEYMVMTNNTIQFHVEAGRF